MERTLKLTHRIRNELTRSFRIRNATSSVSYKFDPEMLGAILKGFRSGPHSMGHGNAISEGQRIRKFHACPSDMIYIGFLNRVLERGVYPVSNIEGGIHLRGRSVEIDGPSPYYLEGRNADRIKIYDDAPTLFINCDE